jgi:hypothetical protein
VLPDGLAQHGLRGLIDCGADILDGDHRRHRIDESEIGERESAAGSSAGSNGKGADC